MNDKQDRAVRSSGSSPNVGSAADDAAMASFLDAVEQRLASTVALVGEVEQVQIVRRELPRARAGNPAAVRLLAEVAEGFFAAQVAHLDAAAVAAMG